MPTHAIQLEFQPMAVACQALLDRVADAIERKFGKGIVGRGRRPTRS